MFGNRMKNCSVFASLISPSKMILFEKKYQTFDTVFHHQMKHLEVRQKYSAARRIFNSLLGVSSGDETLRLMFDILREDNLNFPPSQIWLNSLIRIDNKPFFYKSWFHGEVKNVKDLLGDSNYNFLSYTAFITTIK